MDRKKETKIRSRTDNVDFYPMAIIMDKKQTSIRIPREVVEALEIDPKKDIFVFAFNKKELTLIGSLEDSKIWWGSMGEELEEND